MTFSLAEIVLIFHLTSLWSTFCSAQDYFVIFIFASVEYVYTRESILSTLTFYYRDDSVSLHLVLGAQSRLPFNNLGLRNGILPVIASKAPLATDA